MESRLGPDVGFLQPGQMGMIPQVRSLIEAGKKPPQRITSGFAAPGAPTNTSIWWKRSFDGSLRSIDVSFEDLDASVGILAQSYELGSGEVILPEAPTPADVADVNDLPAVALLATTEDWRGVCRNDEALLSPETLACYRGVVGASTVDEWMTARLSRSWTRPEECG